MHSFLLRVLSFFCLFILVSVFLFILKSNSKEWWKINGYEPQIDGIFLQKKENFDQFIIDNKSINLVSLFIIFCISIFLLDPISLPRGTIPVTFL